MPYSQMRSRSPCSILLAVIVNGGSEEIACRLLAFDIGIGTLHLIDRMGSYSVHNTNSLVRVYGDLNVDREISES